MKELEARLLAAIATQEQFAALEEAGLGQADFEAYGPMYHYIASVLQQTGRAPRLRDLKETFSLPEGVVRNDTEFSYTLSEYRRVAVARKLQSLVDQAAQEYGEDPDKLVDVLQRGLMGIQSTATRRGSVTDSSMPQRLRRYAEMAQERGRGQIVGIPTGISYFDERFGLGWLPGELEGVVGRTYIGKSWLLLYFGIMAWQAGNTVIFASPEMSVEETEARFDALVMARHDIPVEVNDFYRGYSPDIRMQSLADRIGESRNWITESSSDHGAFTLNELGRLVQRHHPQMLIVDGLLLLEGPRRQQVWEIVKELSYGLKTLAVVNNIVVLVSHQATRSAHNTARPPGLHEIAGGDDFARACDRVLALSSPVSQGDEETLRITIQKFRKGQALPGGLDFRFAPGRGQLYELGEGSLGGDGDSRESLSAGQGIGSEMPIP